MGFLNRNAITTTDYARLSPIFISLRQHLNGRTTGWGAVLLICVCTVGCLAPPIEVPANLDHVIAAKTTFQVDPNEPLGDLTGFPVESIASLDGCWGSAWTPPTQNDRSSGLDIFQVLSFDAANGRLVRSLWQDVPLLGSEVSTMSGDITLTAAGELRWQVDEVLSTGKRGTLEPVSFESFPDYAIAVRLEGEDLLAVFEEIDTPRTSGGFADLVMLRHTPFVCVDE